MRMTLRDYVERYARRFDASPGYRNQMRWCVNGLEKLLGRTVHVDEVTVELINDFVADMRGRLSTVTCHSRRNLLFRLIKTAFRDDRVTVKPPKPLRDDLDQVKRKYRPPMAWSPDQVAHLLKVCRGLRGYYRTTSAPLAGVDLPLGHPWIARSDYWFAYILAAWDSGLRSCDLTRITRNDVLINGRFTIAQQKTGRAIVCQFREDTLRAIEAMFQLSPNRTLLWPIWCGRGPWFRTRQRILRRAGLEGSLGKLRASAGTAAEIEAPGSGHRFLGNTEEVFRKHYFDARFVKDLPLPPLLPPIEPDPPRIEHKRPIPPRLQHRRKGGTP